MTFRCFNILVSRCALSSFALALALALGCSSSAFHEGDASTTAGNSAFAGQINAASHASGGTMAATQQLGGNGGQALNQSTGAAGSASAAAGAGSATPGGQWGVDSAAGVAGSIGAMLGGASGSPSGGATVSDTSQAGSAGTGSGGLSSTATTWGMNAGGANAGANAGHGGAAGEIAWNAGAGRSSVPEAGVAGNGVAGSGSNSRTCNMHSDCDDLNPHPHSCSAKCVAGFCVVAVDPTNILSASNVTGGVSTPVTSVWDGAKPYVVFAPPANTTQEGYVVIKLQQLRDDNLPNGSSASFVPTAGLVSVEKLSATLRSGKLGLMWHGKRDIGTSTPDYVLEFAESTLTGAAASTTTLRSTTVGTNLPEIASQIFVTTTNNNYAMLAFSGTPRNWKGYAGDAVTASINGTPLGNSPVDADASVAVLADTIFVTGRNCNYMDGACQKQLELQRYSAFDLTRLGTNTQLSTSPAETSQTFSPAIGSLGATVGVFWNETIGGAGLQLVRCTLAANGNYVKLPISGATNLIPKAIAGFAGGGGTLFAARSTSGTTFELVAQRFDGNLALIGAPVVLSSALEGEPTDVEAHVDATGQKTLLTYRQGTLALYNQIHAGLCREQ
jgi:hypothetical protein